VKISEPVILPLILHSRRRQAQSARAAASS
jgi:hypothetical protein